VPAIFAFIVLGLMKHVSHGSSHALRLKGSFMAIEQALLDFFDAAMLLCITFECTGVNFVYFSSNPGEFSVLRVGFVVTFMVSLLERLLTSLLSTLEQCPVKKYGFATIRPAKARAQNCWFRTLRSWLLVAAEL